MIARPESIQEALYNAVSALGQKRGVDPSWLSQGRLEAELLLAHTLGISRAQLLARLGEPMSSAAAAQFAAMIARRAQSEPLAYIVGRKEFFGMDFIVDRRVLIPRPETELLVERALEHLEHRSWLMPVVVDLGTGSGAIAIALRKRVSRGRVIATDISLDALQVARLNARRHGIEERLEFLQGDLLEPVSGPVDLLLANLPYIPAARERDLPREIRDYEPRLATIAGLDGLALVRRLLRQSPPKLAREAVLLLELSEEQGPEAMSLAREFFPKSHAVLHQDLEGLDRMLEIGLGRSF